MLWQMDVIDKNSKIAMNSDLQLLIFHDSLDVIGGGEKVVATIAKAFDAPIAAANVDPKVIRELGIEQDVIYDLGRIDNRPPIGPIKLSLLFRKASFRGFDKYLLSGFWSLYAAYRHKPSILYCYTPRRDFYDLKKFSIAHQSNLAKKVVAWTWTTAHSYFDRGAVRKVTKILTLSLAVQKRIAKYYKRDSTVIYPPVPTDRYRTKEFGDFWLSVNRLYPEKRVELQIDAFKSLPDENLLIVGGYAPRDNKSLFAYHRVLADLPPNVKIFGTVPEERLLDLYATCKGVVHTPIDEDFGLVPVEAQASGKAVVGVNEGGLRETVINGITGFLVDPHPESLKKAIQRVSEEPQRYEKACKKNASRFDESIFIASMRQNFYNEE
jgi:glycosyltransferase involved in cell wall biosynthesis